jgi:hypothetical protein
VEQASTLIAGKSPPQPHLVDAMAMFAETRLGLAFDAPGAGSASDVVQARRACDLCLGTARMQMVGRPRAHFHAGTYQWRTGRTRSARRTWERGLAIAEAFQFRFEEGLLRARLSLVAATDDERAAQLARAEEIARTLGLPRDLIIRPSSRHRT